MVGDPPEIRVWRGETQVERLRSVEPMQGRSLDGLWDLVGGDEFDEELKLREETRKISALPDLPIQATCVRTPVLVGHGQAIWVETEEPFSPEQAGSIRRGGAPCGARGLPDPELGGRVMRCSSDGFAGARTQTSSRSGL